MNGPIKTMRRPRLPARQRGVAVITALLLTTLAISLVASLFWQQQVQVRSMENQRLHLQTKWILRGALDWATLVLRQDGYDHPNYTALDHVWATPLAETRLDQYIERERVQGENFNATLSGNIIDATSRYNLTNLARDGQVDQTQVKVFRRLLQNVQLDQGLAERAARVVATTQTVAPKEATPDGGDAGGGTAGGGSTGGGSTGGGTPNPPVGRTGPSTTMKLLQVDDLLAVPGFDQAAVDKLRPFVIVLPEQTPVNVNTAPAEVLAAVLPKTSVSGANALLARRKQAPWNDFLKFRTEVGEDELAADVADVKSSWFLVDSRIQLDRAALNAEALVYRPLGGFGLTVGGTQVKWIRQN
jgi:general secretion pathway protein K